MENIDSESSSSNEGKHGQDKETKNLTESYVDSGSSDKGKHERDEETKKTFGRPPCLSQLMKSRKSELMEALNRGQSKVAYGVLRDISERGQGTLIKGILDNHLVPFMLTQKDSDGLTVLHHAAHEGNANLLNHLVSIIVNDGRTFSSERDREGRSVLHHAVMSGCINVVESVLKFEHFREEHDKNGLTPLHHAVRQGNKQIVDSLLKANASVTHTDKSGKAALHHVAQATKDQSEIAKALLSLKSETEIFDLKGATPLHYAAESGQCDVIEVLVQHGADVNCLDMNEATPVHYAVKADNIEAIQTLLLKGSNPDITDSSGKTAADYAIFHKGDAIKEMLKREAIKSAIVCQEDGLNLIQAAWQNNLSKAEALLKKGVPVNYRNWKGNTALQSSAKAGHVEITKFLLKSGANVNLKDKQGKSSLHYAAEGGFVDVVDLLLSNGAVTNTKDNMGKTPLNYVIQTLGHFTGQLQSGPFQVIEMLLNKETDCAHDLEGKTVLHYAVQSGNPKIIQMLLKERPKRIDWTDREGKTVLHYGVQSGNPKIIQMLFKERPKRIDWTDSKGKTVLHYAVQSGNPDIIQMLLKETPEVIDWTDTEGKTVLHYAIQSGNPEIIQMLLKEKPKLIDWRDREGKTVLHYAVQSGNPKIIQILLKEKPKSIDVTEREGKTVLHYAVQSGNPEIIQMLLKEKPKLIDWRDREGKTVLHYAVQSGNPKIIQMLRKEKPERIAWTEGKAVYAVQQSGNDSKNFQMLLKEKPKLIDWRDSEGKAMQSSDREIIQMPIKDFRTPKSKVRPLGLEQQQEVHFGAFQAAEQAGHKEQTLPDKSTGSLKQEELACQKTTEVEVSKFLELEKTISVGNKGEVIKLGDCSLTIPPGSLCTSQDISVALKNPVHYYGYFDDVGLYSSVDIASSHVVKVRPSGVQFSSPLLLRMRLYRPPRSDEQIVVLCGSHKQDENEETKVLWEDVTSQCTTDDSLENISINIYHFCWYLVIYKLVPLQMTSFLSRLNLITFKYHVGIFIKRDHPQDSYCHLCVVFMSSDIYRETKNSQQDLTVPTGLKDQGYELVSEREGAYVYKDQTLKVYLQPGAQCGLGPQEECLREVSVDPSTWWSKGKDVSFTLHCEEDSSFAGGSVKVDDGEHMIEVTFKADDWCRYFQQIFKLEEVANLLPLARELGLSDEQTEWLVQHKWQNDKEQLEELLEIRARNNPNETLQELKLVVGDIEMAGEQHITARGQMHIDNLREYKEIADGLIHECSSKEENINQTAKFLLSSFLQDCCIQTMNTDDAMKGSEPKQCLVHLFENGYATREVHEKLKQCFTESTHVDFQTISKLVATLIQMAKRIFKRPFEISQLTGMWGFFSEDPEIQTILSNVKTAMKTIDCRSIIGNICDLLAQLCIKNEHMIRVPKGVLEEWRLWSSLRDILRAAEVFMKCGESLKIKMRIEAKGGHLSAILVRKEEGKYLLRDLGNLAFCLTKFATFEASNIVCFTVTRNKELLPSPHLITYNREQKMFAQTFSVVNTQEPCIFSCQADVNADGGIKTLGTLRAEVVSSGDIVEIQEFLAGKRSIRVVFHENRTRMLVHGTSKEEMDEITQSIKNRFNWMTTDVIASQELKLVMASEQPCGSRLCLTLFYHYGDQGISHQGDKLSVVYEEVPDVRGSTSCNSELQIDKTSDGPSPETTLILDQAISAGEMYDSKLATRPSNELAAVLDQMNIKGNSKPVVLLFQDQRKITTTTVHNQQTYQNECHGPTVIGDQGSLYAAENIDDN